MLCRHCQTDQPDEDDLFLFRSSGQWDVRCRRCADDPAVLPQPQTLGWLDQFAAYNAPPEVVNVVNSLIDQAQETTGGFDNLLNADVNSDFMLNEKGEIVAKPEANKLSTRQSSRISARNSASKSRRQKRANKREYDRHQVNLTVSYRLADKLDFQTAPVLDLSKGGFKFAAERKIKTSEKINVHFTAPVNFRGEAEVRRCVYNPDTDKFEVGARFVVKPQNTNRKAERHNVLFNLWYSRPPNTEIKPGTLIDISGGGMALIVQEAVPVGEILLICARGTEGVLKNKEVLGEVKVLRANNIYTDNYELGTRFIKTKVSTYTENIDAQPEKITL